VFSATEILDCNGQSGLTAPDSIPVNEAADDAFRMGAATSTKEMARRVFRQKATRVRILPLPDMAIRHR
jgi:hypothetical protein